MQVQYLIAWEDGTWSIQTIEVPLRTTNNGQLLEWAEHNLYGQAQYRKAVLFNVYSISLPATHHDQVTDSAADSRYPAYTGGINMDEKMVVAIVEATLSTVALCGTVYGKEAHQSIIDGVLEKLKPVVVPPLTNPCCEVKF